MLIGKLLLDFRLRFHRSFRCSSFPATECRGSSTWAMYHTIPFTQNSKITVTQLPFVTSIEGCWMLCIRFHVFIRAHMMTNDSYIFKINLVFIFIFFSFAIHVILLLLFCRVCDFSNYIEKLSIVTIVIDHDWIYRFGYRARHDKRNIPR